MAVECAMVPPVRLGRRVDRSGRRAQAVALPDGISLEEGACLGIPALTAWYALHHTPNIAGKTVLVVGGAGSVARYAIAMAKARGARLLASTSVEEKRRYALDAGADLTLDYRAPDFAERILAETDGKGLDVCASSPISPATPDICRRSWPTTAPSSSTAPVERKRRCRANAIMRKNIRMQFVFVYEIHDAERPAALADVNALLERRTITKPRTLVFDLDRIVEAHEAVEDGSRIGQVLVRIGG